MIRLSELVEQLVQNELSQISINKQNPGEANEHNIGRIVNNINLGLTALHRRFNLRVSELEVTLHPDIDIYVLDRSKVTRQDPTDARYLRDSRLFELGDSLLKVIRVVGDSGVEFSLNDLSDPFGLQTPRYNLLKVPVCILKSRSKIPQQFKTEKLKVFYQANHPKLGKWSEDGFAEISGCMDDLFDVEIDIPYIFIEPLCYWVASRFHNPVGMTNEFHAGNSFYAKYEAACQRIEHEGFQVDRNNDVGFRRLGWA